MKYGVTVEVEAEQFLPEEDKIPEAVMSDGPRSPKNDPRANWIVHTVDGAQYPKPGDYIVSGVHGYFIVDQDTFEKNYTEVEPSGV